MSVEKHLELLCMILLCYSFCLGWLNKRLTHHPSDAKRKLNSDLVARVFSCLELILLLFYCFGYDYCDSFSFVSHYLLFLSPFSFVRVTEIFAFTITQTTQRCSQTLLQMQISQLAILNLEFKDATVYTHVDF